MKPWLSLNAPFRPPRGKTHLLIIAWLYSKYTKAFWWTLDSGDTWQMLPNAHEIVEKVRLNQGGVVLMHSFHKKDLKRQEYVMEVTRRLICLAREENLNICTASEYLKLIN